MTEFRSCRGTAMCHRSFWLLLICLLYVTAGHAKNLLEESASADTAELTNLADVKRDLNEDGTSDLIGDTVTVAGISNIATGILHENYLQIFIQDGATGMSLFATSFDEPVSRGDSVIATGVIQEYYGLTEINVIEYRVVPGTEKKIT